MPDQRLTTYADLVDFLIAHAGGSSQNKDVTFARGAVQDAMREFISRHEWSYYYANLSILTTAPYSTGTVAYDHTGGANERQLTLTSGTWPSDAANGCVIIDNKVYEVDSRVSDSVVTLSANSNPGADVAALTEYTWYRDTYPLPVDFVQLHGPFLDTEAWLPLAPTTPKNWLQHQRLMVSPGEPVVACIVGDPSYMGARALRLSPPPSTAKRYEAVYRRRPRQLNVHKYETGTITIVADSATVTGSGTAFTDLHVGAVIRPGQNASTPPTGTDGPDPAAEERTIISRTSATVVTVDTAFDYGYSGVAYTISDPIDADEGYLNAIRSLAMARLAAHRSRETYPMAKMRADEDLLLALEQDNAYPVARGMGGSAFLSDATLHLRYGRDGA
jgi:hypothetical protein